MEELRDWQKRALDDLSQWKPTSNKSGFLIEATPGAGKTRVAIEAARRAFDAGTIDRIVIAVPTASLESQWHKNFLKVGLNVNPEWHSSIGVLPADENGCAATYSEIANQPKLFRKLVSERNTLAILDEVHHCANDKHWGDGVDEAFSTARMRILLSGTPFRSDNNEIPFVNYVDGTGVPDHRYGYGQALDERVVRAVWFPRRGGRSEWTYRGREQSATFDDKLGKEAANQRLRTAISPQGDWLPSVLADADRQLMELRKTDPTAAGIVFCEDAWSAKAVVSMLTGMGRRVTLAISKEIDSRNRINNFEDSNDQWLVSIRQVSEGVDIPRLRVGVYATNYVTELFFRQALGRLVRRRENEEDPTAYLFIPDDERLRHMAETIRDVRNHVLNRQLEEDTNTSCGGDGLGAGQGSLFKPISSTAEDCGVIVDADTITPEQYAEAERIKLRASETTNIPTPQVFMLLKNAGHFNTSPDESLNPERRRMEPPTMSPLQRKKKLAAENSTTVAQIVYQLGLEFALVHKALNGGDGVKVRKMGQCTEDQLQQRLKLARQWLADGFPPPGVTYGR